MATKPEATAKNQFLTILVLLLSLSVLAWLCGNAKPVWYDEYVTRATAHQTTIFKLFEALRNGGDVHPPLDYLFRHFCIGIFGDTPFALRLPSMICGLIACGVFYLWLLRRVERGYAVAGVLLLLQCRTWEYFYEARPYAFFLAASICVIETYERLKLSPTRLNHILFCSAVALTCSAHYYGILFITAFSFADLAPRLRDFKSLLNRTSLYAIGAASGLATILPFALSSKRTASNMWTEVSYEAFLRIYADFFGRALGTIIISIAVLFIFRRLKPEAEGTAPKGSFNQGRTSNDDAALYLLSSLVLLPIIAFVAARLYTGAFLFRYIIPVNVGFTGLVILILSRSFPRRSHQLIFVSLIGLSFLGLAREELSIGRRATENKRELLEQISKLRARYPEQPIVIGDRYRFFVASFYGPSGQVSYLQEPQDNPADLPQAEFAIRALRPLTSASIVDFQDRPKNFLVIFPERSRILEKLVAAGDHIQLSRTDENVLAYFVSESPKPDEAPR